MIFIVYRVLMGGALIGLVSTGRVEAMPPATLADCKVWKDTSAFSRTATCEAGLLSVGDYSPVPGESFVESAVASMKAASPSVTYEPNRATKVTLGDGEHEAVLVVGHLADGSVIGRTLVLENLAIEGSSLRRGLVCSRLGAKEDDADCQAALERMRRLSRE